MGIAIATYRARIDAHHLKCYNAVNKFLPYLNGKWLQVGFKICKVVEYRSYPLPLVICMLLLLRSGNVELNPGPLNSKKSTAHLSINEKLFNENNKWVANLQSYKGITIVHLNIRSLYHKPDFVKLMLEQ